MFCPNCGLKIDDDSTHCPYCGVKTTPIIDATKDSNPSDTNVNNDVNLQSDNNDGNNQNTNSRPNYTYGPSVRASGAWVLLGLCFPVLGFIFYFVFRNKKPDVSKKSGIGALIGIIIEVALSTIYIILIVLGLSTGLFF